MFFISTRITSDQTSAGANPTAGNALWLVAYRIYGEEPPTANRYTLLLTSGTSATSQEQTVNSRSATPPVNSGVMGFGGGASESFMGRFGVNLVSHFAFIPRPNSMLRVDGSEAKLAVGCGMSNAGPLVSSFVALFCGEGENLATRRINRRSRRGYFQRMGNDSHLMKRTGGGAFELMRPHFMNDITYVDPSAWKCSFDRNGDVNLFPPPTPPPTVEDIGLRED